jgi:hypothetical protein
MRFHGGLQVLASGSGRGFLPDLAHHFWDMGYSDCSYALL